MLAPMLRSRVLLCLGFLALLAVACKDGVAPVPVRVAVDPTGTVSLNVGDSLVVRATVQNASDRSVSFSSSNPGVATVSQTGVVRGVSAGTATITATAAADPQATASVQVQVQPGKVASVVIQGLLSFAGDQTVDPSRVQGRVLVQLAVEPGNAARLEVLVDTAVLYSQELTAPAGSGARPSVAGMPVDVRAPIQTASYNLTTGFPRVYNGPTRLTARLLAPDGRVLPNSATIPIVLANPNDLDVRVAAAREQRDAAGQRWGDGDVTTSVLPVIYDRGVSLARVEFLWRTPSGSVVRIVDTTVPFDTVFREQGVLAGVTDPAFSLGITTVTSTGADGPSRATVPFRYDNEPPTPGTLVARDWIGMRTEFASTYNAVGEVDRGVGGVTARFYAGDPSLNAEQLVVQGKQVTRGSDLTQAPLHSYRLAARICDALDNCVTRDGFAFGVDLTAPPQVQVSLADRAVNPGTELELRAVDDHSGFDARPVEALVQVLEPRSPTPRCGPTVEGRDLPGRELGATCVPDTVGTGLASPPTATATLPVPRTAGGYYTYTLTPFDRGGNQAATVTRTVLVDRAAPTLSGLSVPAQLNSGEEMLVSVDAGDNLDLIDVSLRLSYPNTARTGQLSLAFDTLAAEGKTPVGRAFDGVLTTAVSLARRFPFVRSLTYAASGSPATRSTVVVDSVAAIAVDAAQAQTRLSRFLVRSTFGNDTSAADPFPTLSAAAGSVNRNRVCTQRCDAGEPTGVRFSMQITDESVSGPLPFARVYYYRRGADGVAVLVGAPSPNPSTVASGTQRTIRYEFDYTPPAGLTGTFTLFAVGVTSRGAALVTDLETTGAPRVEFYTRATAAAASRLRR